MTLRPFDLDPQVPRITAEDYALISPWWTARGGNPPPHTILPGCGMLATHDDQPVACAFMYLDATGSGVAWLSWLATNPAAHRITAGKALVHCIRFLIHHARSLNYWLISATYNTPSLIRHLIRQGFQYGDSGMIQLFRTT